MRMLGSMTATFTPAVFLVKHGQISLFSMVNFQNIKHAVFLKMGGR